jgi:cell division GTPase FtsZ
VPNKIQLGVHLEGLGAGANPDVGQQCYWEYFRDWKNVG